jgi:hypothetical protein
VIRRCPLASLSLDARELHHLGPFPAFIDQSAEVGGRAGKNSGTDFRDLGLDLGIGTVRIDLCVEPLFAAAPTPNQMLASKPGIKLATVGTPGRASAGAAWSPAGAAP